MDIERHLDEPSAKWQFCEWRRKAYPLMRRSQPVGITVSTGCRRVYECLCGASESCATRWPVTRRVKDFVARHNESCWPVRS